MRFVWDREKSRANLRKHHVSFETACEAFNDPLHRSILDRVVDGDGEIVRIISARKATRKERREYEDG
jgi:uncharacterized DUF497 family protein